MLLLTGREMAEFDQKAINEYGIPGIVLMENAALKTFYRIKEILGDVSGKKIIILVGKGNNGGDGLALARHLANAGAKIRVFLLFKDNFKGDALINFNILKKMSEKIYEGITENLNLLKISLIDADMVVDAIYGTGFRGALPPEIREVVEIVNQADAVRLAVDIPSGVDASTGQVEGVAFQADYTVTFGLPKVGQILFPGRKYCGEIYVEDISFPEKLKKEFSVRRWLIEEKLIKKIIKPVAADTHKGRQGFTLVAGGSRAYSGAPLLSARGCLASGVGGVYLAVPEELFEPLAGKVPEIILRGIPAAAGQLAAEGFFMLSELLSKVKAAVIGPGMGELTGSKEAYLNFLESCPLPLVIDADGLNNLVGYLEVLKRRTAPTVLTPHLGEMARLLGLSVNEVKVKGEEISKEFTKEYNVYLVLKSETTLIAAPTGEVWYLAGGNPLLAKAGSGDVLSGLIAGFLTQGYGPEEAAILGVYFHGRAGELALKERAVNSFFISDIFSYLNEVFREVGGNGGKKNIHMER
ncbi:bifunctional ADP-dependent NAD(P)H-hydrate dehydratase/NAD(P)H-hydrate epimerase [Carboxydothermus hydrogenoformans]|uniref:Bifunctional NAD(P)H-hydrate repair enzyme n=1 Tax=Carboxydothermus hydrogenoformans (strain ATCC BAA-161 / DSM 6008 / Z-2901) TaxID=246194 RepID=Q3AEB4_CARHZ|nr:bifunctional ADP-dependent NAD(P)H-hydrate dehydratase/NAD(P)H-hydrate epimerase [Carboxydothermus hydrogenoformans]ABB14985.1 conserved hypothetical protein [Carboxydothermus hydrogenoformans Z-2901]